MQEPLWKISGTENRTLQMKKSFGAAKGSQCHEFITELEQGYDTDIGRWGVKLSGGQKQRFSIARVFLKNPPILILMKPPLRWITKVKKNCAAVFWKIWQRTGPRLSLPTGFPLFRRLREFWCATEDGIAEEGTHEETDEKRGNLQQPVSAVFCLKNQKIYALHHIKTLMMERKRRMWRINTERKQCHDSR